MKRILNICFAFQVVLIKNGVSVSLRDDQANCDCNTANKILPINILDIKILFTIESDPH